MGFMSWKGKCEENLEHLTPKVLRAVKNEM